MASFVSTSSDEEQVIEIAKHVNKLQIKGKEPNETFTQEITKLFQEKKETEVLEKLINEIPLVFADGGEKEIEGYFLLIISFAQKLNATTSVAALTKIQTALTSNHEDKPALRLKLLNDMYNIISNTQIAFRFNLYIAMIKFALSYSVDIVLKDFSSPQSIQTRVQQWGLNTEQIRVLYKLIRDTFRDNGRSIEAHHWLVKYLATFDGPDSSTISDAAAAALEAIRLPNLLQFDSLLDLAPVKQLETSKDHAKLFQLLKIFVGENFEAYKAFVAANADYLKTIGLKEEECTFKMRLLSLATLGAANQEIPYSLIAKTLQLEESDVETWVITAMSEDILDAKMDQSRRVVTISRCLQRIFTKTQWKQLSDNLANWRNNTKSILKTIQDTKLIAEKQKS